MPRHHNKVIEGIQDAIIKPLNQKLRDIENPTEKQTRVHSSLTIHEPKNVNRPELIQKLEKRFIN